MTMPLHRQYAAMPQNHHTSILQALSYPFPKEDSVLTFEGKGTYILGAYEFICHHCDEELRKMIQTISTNCVAPKLRRSKDCKG